MFHFAIGPYCLLPAIVVSASIICGSVQAQELSSAIQRGDLQRLREFIRNDPASVNRSESDRGELPLVTAIQAKQIGAVKLLLAGGADVNGKSKGRRVLHHLIERQVSPELEKLILDRKPDVSILDVNKRSVLELAIQYNRSKQTIRQLLELGADPNADGSYGQTAWQMACQYQRRDIASLFAETADLQATDQNGNTYLMTACTYRIQPVANSILDRSIESGIDIDRTNKQGQTALHLACQTGLLPLVKKLIENGANINAVDVNKQTPLLMSVYSNNNEVVQFILGGGAKLPDPSDSNQATRAYPRRRILETAIAMSNPAIVETLLKAGVDPNERNPQEDSLLALAAAPVNLAESQRNNPDSPQAKILKLLCRYKANPDVPNSNGYVPLEAAAFAGFVSGAEILCTQTDLNRLEGSIDFLFDWSCRNGAERLAREIIKSNPQVVSTTDADGKSPLMIAAEFGTARIVNNLIAHRADVNATDALGNTALMTAAAQGRSEVVKLLLDAKAIANSRDSSGQTPLHLASWAGSQPTVTALLVAGGDPNAKTPSGSTSLHIAAWLGHAKLVDQLKSSGGKVGAVDADGWTPLHKAAFRGNLDAVKALVNHGADKSKETAAGMTARQLAEDQGHTKISGYFESMD